MNKRDEWIKKSMNTARTHRWSWLVFYLAAMNFWYCPRFHFTHHIHTCRMNVSKFELEKRFAPIAWEKRLKIFFSRHSERLIPKHFFFSFVDKLKKKVVCWRFFFLLYFVFTVWAKKMYTIKILKFSFSVDKPHEKTESKKNPSPNEHFSKGMSVYSEHTKKCAHTFWWFFYKFGANDA